MHNEGIHQQVKVNLGMLLKVTIKHQTNSSMITYMD